MQNFNMSFSNNKADVLIHLTQWQYWWWFWFAFLWVLYYLLVARVFRYRTLKFNPRIASTLRPHGKWGDLLTCLIPVTWCLNILLNSNFILKLIEWQSESSLFTLRVRAKQWYWIYKLDLRNIADIFSAPRNVGRNKWQFATFGDLQTAEDYLHIMQMRAFNAWSKEFWTELGKKFSRKNSFNLSSSVDVYKTEFLLNSKYTIYENILSKNNLFDKFNLNNFDKFRNNTIIYNKSFFLLKSFIKKDDLNYSSFNKNLFYKKDFLFLNKPEFDLNNTTLFYKNRIISGPINATNFSFYKDLSVKTLSESKNTGINNFLQNSILNNYKNVIENRIDLEDENRFIKRSFGKTTPIRLLKCPSIDFLLFKPNNVEDYSLIKFRFNEKKPSLSKKPVRETVYLTFKQKRYNQRNNIGKKNESYFNKDEGINKKYSGNPFLKDLSIIEENYGNPTRQYRMLKKAKSRLDTTKVSTWNRLLRSRRVLVLPAHVNITVITNSFDIVHSWHIPGLGLKMDCLPGRATHHTLYIDNVGLYYGQCAEICGRYHHHMPIRVCALPFEHFLVWWHTFGLPKFIFSKDESNLNFSVSKYFTRKFSW
jgi:heme/copper-type cytochrome/quinol oxidase subunit 2